MLQTSWSKKSLSGPLLSLSSTLRTIISGISPYTRRKISKGLKSLQISDKLKKISKKSRVWAEIMYTTHSELNINTLIASKALVICILMRLGFYLSLLEYHLPMISHNMSVQARIWACESLWVNLVRVMWSPNFQKSLNTWFFMVSTVLNAKFRSTVSGWLEISYLLGT